MFRNLFNDVRGLMNLRNDRCCGSHHCWIGKAQIALKKIDWEMNCDYSCSWTNCSDSEQSMIGRESCFCLPWNHYCCGWGQRMICLACCCA